MIISVEQSVGQENLRTKDVRGTADTHAEHALQAHLLEGVSRTFALTIPQLPPPLRAVVSNAYLLCRIVDTIEDEPALDGEDTRRFAEEFVRVVAGEASPEPFARELGPRLTPATIPAEHELIRCTPQVIVITHSFNPRQRDALEQCVRMMAQGMVEFQQSQSLDGLPELGELDRYCYHVAGVVGEMLTKLFCDYSPAIARNERPLLELSVSFGQGLQMTNILKDIWDDHKRGACWLPRDVFAQAGFDLRELKPGRYHAGFGAGLERLIAIAHQHLRNAVSYTLLIPGSETGLRNFCLWAISMAALTLRNIHRRRDFSAGSQVKISRRSVKAAVLASQVSARSDLLVRLLFRVAGRGLPMAGERTG